MPWTFMSNDNEFLWSKAEFYVHMHLGALEIVPYLASLSPRRQSLASPWGL